MIVPGGGLSPKGTRWVAYKPGFFLHARALSGLFCRLFLEGLIALHRTGELAFFGDLTGLSSPHAFAGHLAPQRKIEWVVYAKSTFRGPEAVLAYLSRYTHRIAISNSRLISADANTVTFRWKDCRVKSDDRRSVMRLATTEIIRHCGLRAPCPDCGGAMRIIETFRRGQKPQSRAPPRKVAA